jgi:hypothetical protein
MVSRPGMLSTGDQVLMDRFHYLVTGGRSHREALSVKPASSTSARGKLVSWRSHLLALIYEGQDIVMIDLHSDTEVGRIDGAGGAGCQEVLYDVSLLIDLADHSLILSAISQRRSVPVRRHQWRVGRDRLRCCMNGEPNIGSTVWGNKSATNEIRVMCLPFLPLLRVIQLYKRLLHTYYACHMPSILLVLTIHNAPL